MNRLARYVENEFDRNSWFFAQSESSMLASIDFIKFVLRDEKLVALTEKERDYITKIQESYIKLLGLAGEIKKEIQNYKELYCEYFLDN